MGDVSDIDIARAEIADLRATVGELVAAARDCLDEVDKMLLVDPPPIKYRAPYGSLARLRHALRAFDTSQGASTARAHGLDAIKEDRT